MKILPQQYNLHQTLKLALWGITIVLFVFVLSKSIINHKLKECNNVYIKIDHATGLFFIAEEDILTAIKNEYSSDLEGLALGNIDFTDIEEKLELNPFIRNAEIYFTLKGDVYVDIQQREPLVRVVNNSGVSFYIDVKGDKMPLSSKFTARVVVATGNIDADDDSLLLDDLVKLCKFIAADNFWKAQFEQIHVTENGEFELVPKLGNHIIRLGRTENLHDKFNKLLVFYKEILKNFDADKYRVINLKYDQQIVCTKI